MSEAGADAGALWPRRPGPVLDWLVGEGRRLRGTAELLGELCRRLVLDGMPLARVSLHIRTLHPQVMGERFLWRRDADGVEEARVGHEIVRSAAYRNSPVRVLFEGAGGFRQRLDIEARTYTFPLLDELRAEGLSDYVALPITFSDGATHACTFTTDRPGGFTTEELLRINDLLPVLGVILEAQALRRIGTYVLDTYVGHHAGERILSGQIRRGMGETLRAAIWYADLRGFTAMSERMKRDALIACLNRWFDFLAGPLERHGGEILKFIGDAVLAVFPIHDGVDACRRALQAAQEVRDGLPAFNAEAAARGEERLDCGLALHVGDVMYGNIGAANRLDFTIIGPAVNLAVRIEGLCRTLDENVLISEDFAAQCGCPLPSRGRHTLRGSSRPVEVFALPERVPCP